MTEPAAGGNPAETVSFLDAGKRAALEAGPRAVHQAVLRAFAATGNPPRPAELEDTARSHGLAAAQALALLAAADVLGLDGQGQIRMAYPFSASPTPHEVAITGGPRVYSMCAIDALDIPVMLGTDAVITSTDPLDGTPVTVTFQAGQATWNPASAVVLASRADCDGPAEQVSCGTVRRGSRYPAPSRPSSCSASPRSRHAVPGRSAIPAPPSPRQ